MIPTLTELGKIYKIKDVFGKGYPKLVEATWNAISEEKSSWVESKDYSLLPEYAKRLKEAEAYWSEIDFSIDHYKAGLNKSPETRRTEKDIIPLTSAQLFHMLAQGEEIFPNRERYWGIDCIAESYEAGAGVPIVFWNRESRQVKRNWDFAGYVDRDYACRAGVRIPQALNLPLSDPLALAFGNEITLNGKVYIEKDSVHSSNEMVDELKVIRAEHLGVANKITAYLKTHK